MSVSMTVKVGSPHGLHARPATAVVKLANRFASAVSLLNGENGERADAKSIFDVMTLAARHKAEITITAAGDDEKTAAQSVADLIASDFGDVNRGGGESSILGGGDDDDDDEDDEDDHEEKTSEAGTVQPV